MKRTRIYYLINALTLYRLAAAPFLILILLSGQPILFRWLVGVSFFTDAIDGPLSRKYNVSSIFGSRLDSVADDATVLASIAGLWFLHPEFIAAQWVIITALLALFAVQTSAALIAYGKVTSFHTYLAKLAAVFQALFFILIFFDLPFALLAFYAACLVTAAELVEEIILVLIVPEWKANVKGLYWIWRKKLTVH
jgi:CDP-diacylglycerol--glycerol-3-phosphate 3-phosphatidyltransferase